MKKRLQKVITLIIILTVVGSVPSYSQFKHDVPVQDIRESIIGNPVMGSLFDPSRISTNHHFSLSIMNLGGSMVNVGAYTNSFSLALTPKLDLNTQISLVQHSMTGINSQGSMYYGVGLNYQPTDNSFFSFKISNYPTYYRRPNQHLYLRGF